MHYYIYYIMRLLDRLFRNFILYSVISSFVSPIAIVLLTCMLFISYVHILHFSYWYIKDTIFLNIYSYDFKAETNYSYWKLNLPSTVDGQTSSFLFNFRRTTFSVISLSFTCSCLTSLQYTFTLLPLIINLIFQRDPLESFLTSGLLPFIIMLSDLPWANHAEVTYWLRREHSMTLLF